MRKPPPSDSDYDRFAPGFRYPGLRGKVVDWVEHTFEDGHLYLQVRFTDHTELCWQISTGITIEEGDLSDWKSGDFTRVRVFVRNERARSK